MTLGDGQSNDIHTVAEGNSKWLDAHYDPVANLYTFSQCMCFGDIHADGDMKLIIADLGTGLHDMKLKVFKGTTLMTENTLIDLPTGVMTFYMDQNTPRTPAVAVASGPHVYVYKNLRPFFKFTLPSLETSQIEDDLWNQAKEEKIDTAVLREMIDELRSQGVALTPRSLRFLTLDHTELETYANLHKYAPLKRQTVITCLATLLKSMTEDDSISCLVVGTEAKSIYILDPEAFTVLATISLPSIPVFLSVNGLFDVEYRIIVSCRNGVIYTLKRGVTSVEKGIELNSQPLGMARLGKNIVVTCMDDTLRSYNTKGRKLWTVRLRSTITAMGVMDNKQKGFKAVVVGLKDKTVCIYRDKFLVNQISVPDVVSAILYGRFGREDGALVLATKSGGLLVKFLKRTAVFDEKDIMQSGPPPSQNLKLDVPKKTKLFVDQTLREKENSAVMHRQFMHDLQRLRLNASKKYAEALLKSENPISTNLQEPLKLNAQVTGIGPVFKLTVRLQNTSQSNPIIDTLLSFGFDSKLYSIRRKLIPCPMLIPGVSYSFESLVDCLTDKGLSDVIKVFVLKKDRSVPIITATISMPVSEAAIIV